MQAAGCQRVRDLQGADITSHSSRPRVLVIANDAGAGAALARDLGAQGATPAVTSEVEAHRAVRSMEPSLVIWVTQTVAPAKLGSVVSLAGPAGVALVTDDPEAPVHARKVAGDRIFIASSAETRSGSLGALLRLARGSPPAAPATASAARPATTRSGPTSRPPTRATAPTGAAAPTGASRSGPPAVPVRPAATRPTAPPSPSAVPNRRAPTVRPVPAAARPSPSVRPPPVQSARSQPPLVQRARSQPPPGAAPVSQRPTTRPAPPSQQQARAAPTSTAPKRPSPPSRPPPPSSRRPGPLSPMLAAPKLPSFDAPRTSTRPPLPVLPPPPSPPLLPPSVSPPPLPPPAAPLLSAARLPDAAPRGADLPGSSGAPVGAANPFLGELGPPVSGMHAGAPNAASPLASAPTPPPPSGPPPLPRTGAPTNPGPRPVPVVDFDFAPPRRRRGARAVLLVGLAVVLASGGLVGAQRLGWVRLAALDGLLAPLLGAPGATVGAPATASAPSTAEAATSASASSAGSAAPPASAGSAEPSASAVALGPDAAFAELVRTAPKLDEIVAARGPVPGLAGASVRQLVALAEDANRRGVVEDALQYVALALKREPSSMDARAAHVLVLLRFGDSPTALAQADAYLARGPNALLQELRGDALAALGRFDDARPNWIAEPRNERALAIAKSIALNGGRMRAQKGQTKEAKRYFRRAAVLDMRDLEALTALADLLLLENDAKAAAAWSSHACTVAPQVGAPHALHGRALVALDRPTEALAAFERAVKFNPSDRASVREVVRLRGAPIP